MWHDNERLLMWRDNQRCAAEHFLARLMWECCLQPANADSGLRCLLPPMHSKALG